MKSFPRRWWLVVAALGLSLVGSALVIALPRLELPSRTPLQSSAATPSAPSPTPPPSPAPTPLPATLELEWSEAASFGGENGSVEEVNDATRWSHGFIAVGTHYDRPVPPSRDLPPHDGRIWLSPDGWDWEDMTPTATFLGAHLTDVFEARDGSLIAVGGIHPVFDLSWVHAWRSMDGRNWKRVDLGLPSDFVVVAIESGPLGYVLNGSQGKGYEIWFSDDGLSWDLVWRAPDANGMRTFVTGIGAGQHSFTAFGYEYGGYQITSSLLASTDGRDWPIAPFAPDAFVRGAAPLRDAWIAIAAGGRSFSTLPHMASQDPAAVETSVWTSVDASTWQQIGTASLDPGTLDVGWACEEAHTELHGAAGWLVMSTTIGCLNVKPEGARGYGKPRISTDGTQWEFLPFPELTVNHESLALEDEGSIVRVAMVSSDGLVLAGQSNGRATFWLGTPR